MARPKELQFKPTEAVKNRMKEIDSELKSRGAKDFNINEIIEKLFFSAISQVIIDEFVTQKTPENYKLAQLLETPGEREKILKIIENKKFGIKYESNSQT